MSLHSPKVSHHQLVDAAPLTPAQREAAKSPVQRAEDLIYVVTHTVTCLTCDVLFPVIGAYLSKIRERGKEAVEQHSMWDHFKGWYKAELFGDFGAVVPTIALQRYAPGFMEGLNQAMGKVVGPAYRWGAERSTAKWALENGIEKNSAEYREHADKIYQSEAGHFGQMATWTVLSSTGNILWQRYMEKSSSTAGEIIADKVKAGLTASAIVMGTRAMWPIASQHRDHFMGEHVVLPLSGILGKPFGLDKDAIKQAAHERDESTGHKGRAGRDHAKPGHVVTEPMNATRQAAGAGLAL